MESIERIRSGEIAPLDTETEGARYATWPARAPDHPLVAAIERGAEADRPAWAFMAGYQAALQAVFPEAAGARWRCFAVSEPARGTATTLRERAPGDWRLDGTKSWIAGAAHVDALVVCVGSGAAAEIALVPRDAPGLQIVDPGTARVLPELSQGTARFGGVRVAPPFPGAARIELFGPCERFFVTAATAACMLAQVTRAGGADALRAELVEVLRTTTTIAPALAEGGADRGALAAFGATTAAVAERFSNLVPLAPAFRARWQRDQRLMLAFMGRRA